MTRTAAALCALLLPSLAGLNAQEAPPAKQQPVFVYLFTRVDDHINHELSEDRVTRTLANLEQIRKTQPGLAPSCVFLVTGASSEMFAERDQATKFLSRLREGARAGQLEIGYDGENEPTHLVRPLPNFRNAKTPDERWLARSEAFGWFLTEYKHRLNGEPDPSRPGGLRLAQQVFGPMASVSGIITMELGSDSEAAHLIRQQAPDAILPGLPESDTWPIRNLDGVGGSIAVFSERMSPGPAFAPEVYWQEGFVRMSNMTKFGARTVVANGGPEAFQNLLKSIDRSKTHIIKVYLGSPANYVKPEFNRGVINPLRWAYENPKRQRIANDMRLTDEQVNAAYAKETALLNYLVDDFFKNNPGSRFVSSAEVKKMARTTISQKIPLTTIRAATQHLVQQWIEINTNPPDYARVGDDFFSLADMFYLLAKTHASVAETGKLPEAVELKFVYGPSETPDILSTASGALSKGEIAQTAAVLAKQLADDSFKPVPSNRIPGWITCSKVKMNAAEFLRLMAEGLLAADDSPKLAVQRSWMLGPATEGHPRNRSRWEEGGMWTAKPAPLKLPAKELSLMVQ